MIDMELVQYGQQQITYTIERRKRAKTVAITVTPDSEVVVLAPHHMTIQAIKEMVQKKARWIIEKKKYFLSLVEKFPVKEYVSGEQLLFLGRTYRLKVVEETCIDTEKPQIIGRRIYIAVNKYLETKEKQEIIREKLVKWYFSSAREKIEQRVNRHKKQLGVYPTGIIIKDQKKRWGSCSKNGTLRFNWKTVMAPISVIDYVVVHEMCHLKIKNHSPSYWKLLASVLLNYRKQIDWLKNNAASFKL